ncbi:uncharacterized protein LOC134278659 [Saccostrea cucullata]|uniref:uncharacterized protein LOC134278659 n=1 Tax=Saccostrea cuccullata TaxID=36930 RepID=UPI002ED564AF
MESTEFEFPGMTSEKHPECFNIEAMPPQPKEKKPGQLPDHLIKQFFEEGYILVEDFFDTEKELDPVREAINKLVDGLAKKLHDAGKIKKLYKEFGFFERLTKIEAEFPGANILLHKMGKLPQAFRDLWSNDRLLNVIEQLIGPDIATSPVWNLRTKTPKNNATIVPWHQDSGYFDNQSYKVMIPTAWIPLLNTDDFNGGMQVAKGGHRTGKVATHQCCWGNTWYVMLEEEEMQKSLGVDMEKDVITCPVPYGGMLLFNNLTPHRSLPNISNQIRWALDLRWQRPDQPYGLFNLKDGLLLRKDGKNVERDWEKFESVDRTIVQKKSVEGFVDLFGGACLGLGIFVLVDKNEILVLTRSVDTSSLDVPSLLESAAYALIAGGGFIFFVAFLGCCGAILKNKCMLLVYAVIVGLIFAVEASACILAVLYKSDFDKYAKSNLNTLLETRYKGPYDTSDAISLAFDLAFIILECCGIESGLEFNSTVTSWNTTYVYESGGSYTTATAVIPPTCCEFTNKDAFPSDPVTFYNSMTNSQCPTNAANSYYNQGCYDQLQSKFEAYLYILIGIAAGVGALELIGIIAACCLMKKDKDSDISDAAKA